MATSNTLRLFEAVQDNDVVAVRAILQANPELVNARAKTNLGLVTPLLVACTYGFLEIFRLLLQTGAEVGGTGLVQDPLIVCALRCAIGKHRGGYGCYDDVFPLFMASRRQHATIVEELIQAGASVDQTNSIGQSALHVACMEFDLIQGDNIHNGEIPIGSVGSSNETVASNIIKALLEGGAHVNLQDSNGWTPLHYACDADPWNRIEFLLDNGADLAIRGNCGMTALEIACHYRYTTALEMIKKCNFSPIEVIEAYEVAALAHSGQSRYQVMLKATEMRIQHNLPKTVSEPLDCYGNVQELQTVDELKSYQSDESKLRVQALLARERIFQGRYVYLITGQTLEDILEIPGVSFYKVLKHHLEIFKENNDYLYFPDIILWYEGIVEMLLERSTRGDISALTAVAETAIMSATKMQEVLKTETRPGVIGTMIPNLKQTVCTVGSVVLLLLRMNVISNNEQDRDLVVTKAILKQLCEALTVIVSPPLGYVAPLLHVLFAGNHSEIDLCPEERLQYRYHLMKMFTDVGFNINQTDSDGNTLLHVIISTWPEEFEWLKENALFDDEDEENEQNNGINQEQNNGVNNGQVEGMVDDDEINNSLVPRCAKSTEIIVKLLLECGIYMHARNKKKLTALDMLKHPRSQESFEITKILEMMDKYDEFPSLVRFAALKVSDSKLNYEGEVPKQLAKFVDLH